MQRLKKKGARSKYIDVLNPGSVSSQSSGGAVPPPGLPLMPPMGGLGGGMPQANFFVPESTGGMYSYVSSRTSELKDTLFCPLLREISLFLGGLKILIWVYRDNVE